MFTFCNAHIDLQSYEDGGRASHHFFSANISRPDAARKNSPQTVTARSNRRALGELLVQIGKTSFCPMLKVIVPLPSRSHSRKEKGFMQMEIMCFPIRTILIDFNWLVHTTIIRITLIANSKHDSRLNFAGTVVQSCRNCWLPNISYFERWYQENSEKRT